MARVPEVLGPYLDATSFDEAWCTLARRHGAHPSIAGESVQGRPLRRFDFGDAGHPTVLLTGLLHGIEVVGSVALLRALERLLVDPQRLRLVVLPIVNPDAFVRNMRRSMRGRFAWQRCNANGVDLNRNFPPQPGPHPWHPFAGSRDRRSPHYMGPHPLSEPESRAICAVAREVRPALSLGFHSIGNLVLYPWSYTRAENPRVDRYRSLAATFNRGMCVPYHARQAVDLYPVVGDMDDWLDAELGTYAFTIEVSRPTWAILHPKRVLNPFCWMNPSEIDPVVEDAARGTAAMLDAFSRGQQVDLPRDQPTRRIDLVAR